MQNNILRLEISVNNPVAVKLINRSTDLLHIACSFDLRQRLAAFELLEELPTHSYL